MRSGSVQQFDCWNVSKLSHSCLIVLSQLQVDSRVANTRSWIEEHNVAVFTIWLLTYVTILALSRYAHYRAKRKQQTRILTLLGWHHRLGGQIAWSRLALLPVYEVMIAIKNLMLVLDWIALSILSCSCGRIVGYEVLDILAWAIFSWSYMGLVICLLAQSAGTRTFSIAVVVVLIGGVLMGMVHYGETVWFYE